MRLSLILGLTLALTTRVFAATDFVAQAAPGIVVPIGGALRFDNDAVWSRLVELAGGPGARYVVLPTAGGNPQRAAQRTADALTRHGAQVEILPIAPKWPGADLESARRAAADPQAVAKLRAAAGVFMTGGAQERLTATLAPGGVETPLLGAIRELQARGGVVAGSSAGAAVMSALMFRDAQDPHRILKGIMREGHEIDRGLGFAGPDLFVDQHFLKRGRIGRMLPLMLAKGYRLGVGVDENSALVIRDGNMEVIGGKGALLVDLSEARHDAARGVFNVENARLSYLDRGDRYDLRERRAIASPIKTADLRLDPKAPDFKPEHQKVPVYLDILGDTTIANAMGALVDSPAESALGLAYAMNPEADDPRPDLGFEFILRRDAVTEAWFTTAFGGEDYSVFNMRLDVRPVRLARPLYQPWK